MKKINSTNPNKKILKQQKTNSKLQIRQQNSIQYITDHNKSSHNSLNKLESLPTIKSLLSVPKQQRLQKTKYLLPSVLPFINNYIGKKEGSRVIQLMVKWGDQQIRKKIFEQLKKNWKDMIRGKYSIFVLKQLVSHVNIPEIVQQAQTMQGIKQAALVLEKFIAHTATTPQIDSIKHKFKSLINSEDDKQQQTIDNIVIKIIEKQYYNTILSKYILSMALKKLVSSEREKVLQYLKPKCLELIHDNQGLKLFFELINYYSAKDRKLIVKEFKPEIANIINSVAPFSYLAILKLIHSVDDTILVQKNILKQLQPFLPQIYENKKIFNIIISIFSPPNHNNNILYKWQPHVQFTTSKKSIDIRLGEVRAKVISDVINAIKCKQLSEAVIDVNISKLLIGICKYILTENYQEDTFQFVKEILNLFVINTKKLIIKDREIFEKNSLVCNQYAHKILKTCICISQQVNQQCSSFLQQIISKLQEFLIKDLNKTLSTKSSYILISILENTNNKDTILETIRKSGIRLDNVVGSKIYENLL